MISCRCCGAELERLQDELAIITHKVCQRYNLKENTASIDSHDIGSGELVSVLYQIFDQRHVAIAQKVWSTEC
jgi:hypothetical protein